jgi:hypothetical protein
VYTKSLNYKEQVMSRRTNKQNRTMSSPQQTTVNVDLSSADDITCDSCGNYTFLPVMLMKRLSAILSPTGQEAIIPMQVSPTGQEAIIPMQVFSCNACGWINKEFLPMKESEGEETNDGESSSTLIV